MIRRLFWISAIGISLISCGKSQDKPIRILKYPFNVPVISLDKSISLDTSWQNACNKVVVHMWVGRSITGTEPNWYKYKIKFPNVKFIFYIHAKDESWVRDLLKQPQLTGQAVFWDKERSFAKLNDIDKDITFVSYIVNRKNEIITLSNPSMPDFNSILQSLDDCK